MLKSHYIAGFGLVLALAGCGSSGAAAPEATSSSPTSSAPAAAPASSAPADNQTHTVTFEVLGKGKAMQPIMYVADEDGTASGVDLPWSKTFKVEVVGAEREVGHLLSIVAGSSQTANGQLEAAACRISVDGEQVASGKGTCEYKLK
ncbi:hypothetical protein ABZ297_33715 [Nonomuraea sp. NPDC005983]|uniref:hypothetical protein n=1 Tax=Nonomuraea sp. NPDC005983 TaxID=3155595 RepID=UPI0033BE298B